MENNEYCHKELERARQLVDRVEISMLDDICDNCPIMARSAEILDRKMREEET